MRFEDLDLSENILDALYAMQFDECTPVQENCIPHILEGRDMLGVAQTGTGKTAAYLLPILSKLDEGYYPDDAINCVIMSPTRELAQQIDQAMQGFGYYLNGVSSVAVYGGNDGNRYDQEIKSLRLGADVVIATPGRFLSHISLGNVDLSKVSFFVLDEADRMLDMGFSDDIMNIAKLLPKTCQTIMFSATMPDKIEELAKGLLKNPVEVKLAVSKPAEKIKQTAYVCHETQKLGIINDIFKEADMKRIIVFCGAKQKVKQVSMALQRKKINCGEMHSDLDQAQRDEMMFKFKSGQIDVLVATDIVARGIDIDDITMVINYDVPHDAEDYVHRIGRTARADRDGKAITLVSDDDIFYCQQIEKFLEKEVEKTPLPAELGEGPEYTRQGRAPKRSTSAKIRRRKDRDTTAHRHKPRNNGEAADGGNGRGRRQRDEQSAPKNADATAEQGAKATAPDSQSAQTATDKAEGQQRRRRNNRRRGNGDNGAERTDDQQRQGTQKAADDAQGGRQNGSRRDNRKPRTDEEKPRQGNENERRQENKKPNGTKNRRNGNRNSRTNAKNEPRLKPFSRADEVPTRPVKSEGGLSQLIKKPLKWIKSLGKK